ncbi:RING-H2 finger protein ATL73 [Dendrobium catenatum]|uniref:RING-H2 finger protein ATL73 n=1 Tax=Dendrobium catenatum TaxID=906689 RepID=A0A2I0W370_9ASPA|nr:RING-H2 finger protein ATL73 [Dendrobium catenatum]
MVPVSAPHPSNRSIPIGVSGNTDWNFDKNIVIIPAILLYALLCALGLYSLIPCALRWSQRLPFETTEATTMQLAMTGLKKSNLRRIPVATYRSNTNILTTECQICLVDFIEGEKVRVLPSCNHIFHVRCIDIWLSSHSSCLTCRHSLLDRSVASVCIDVRELPQEMDGNPPIIKEYDEVS